MKIYLDTNIYDYIAKKGGCEELKDYFQKKYIEVVVSLEIFLEDIRIPDEEIKARNYRTIRRLGTKYPKFSESYLETQEVLKEIKRCHPAWLAPAPYELKEIQTLIDRYRVNLKTFRRYGDRKRNESAEEYISQVERAISISNPSKKVIRQVLLKFEDFNIRSNDPDIQELLDPLSLIERFWRSGAAEAWIIALNGEISMRDYKDWLMPYLRRTPPIEKMGWYSFWLRDAKLENITRTYIRGLTEYFQLEHRITHGTSIDANHSLGLIGNDLFLTGDKDFFNALQKVSESSVVTVKIARPVLVDFQNDDVYGEITKAISAV